MDQPESLWDLLPVGVCTLNDRMEVLQLNAAMAKMVSRRLPVNAPVPVTDVHQQFATALEPSFRRTLVMQQVAENIPIVFETDRGKRTIIATIFPMNAADARAGVVATDISEFEQFEEGQRRSGRVEMVQQLAAGIAHDFNNLLTRIMANAGLILESPQFGGAVGRYATDIITASERAAELTRYMLAFSGQRTFVSEGVDLSSVVRTLEPKLRLHLPDNLILGLHLDAAVPTLIADPSQIADVVQILLRNAVEAFDEGAIGHIDVLVGNCSDWVFLEVRDDGGGISPDVLPRIFEPFFTTKFLGRGLGLAAVEGIATGCGGKVLVESELGSGTAVRVLLPVARNHATNKVDGGRFA